MPELRQEVTPAGPYRLTRRGGADGVLRARGGVLRRILHVDGQPVLLRAAQPARDRVVLGARPLTLASGAPAPSAARRRAAAAEALARWRFALDVDADVSGFHAAFADDPLLGRSIRARPWLRPTGRPRAFEALAWGVCEQLIAYVEAAAIERRLVRRHGVRCLETGLMDPPDAARMAALGTAELEACGLAPGRARALRRVAREVAAGRIPVEPAVPGVTPADPGRDGRRAADAADAERGWHRLRQVAEIGPWTIALLAGQGQGRHDVAPAGDLNLRKAIGRIRTGDPMARVDEHEVRAVLDRYAPWSGLAAAHLMAARGDALPTPGSPVGEAVGALVAAAVAPRPAPVAPVRPPLAVRVLAPPVPAGAASGAATVAVLDAARAAAPERDPAAA